MAKYQLMTSKLLFVMIYVITFDVRSSVQQSARCSNYTVLSDAWRNTRPRGDAMYCDESLLQSGTWYRLMQPAGNRIPESPPPINYCGTHAPMWMNGTHPTTILDDPVQRVLCGHWDGRTCITSTTVHVQLCYGGYYVYKAPVVVNSWCNRAWCAETVVIPNYTLSTTAQTTRNILSTIAMTTLSPTSSSLSGEQAIDVKQLSEENPVVQLNSLECTQACANDIGCTQLCIRKMKKRRFPWSFVEKLLVDFAKNRTRW